MGKSNNKPGEQTRIIFHIDGDAFFASCEQSTNLRLRGKPIAVGRERGCATAFSYEAKYLGIKRATPSHEIHRRFPQVLLVSSDYRKYGLFCRRMNEIVKQYTNQVEKASIDECYADMSGVVNDFDEAHAFACKLQDELCRKLGLTVSIGIGASKSIAKICSGLKKPRGVSMIRPEEYETRLYPMSIDSVSGIGTRSVIRMNANGIKTIGDWLRKPIGEIRDTEHRPFVELYQELSGHAIWSVENYEEAPKSISKIRAFQPASNNREHLLSEFSRNIELICTKLRRYNLGLTEFKFGMKYSPKAYDKVSHTITLNEACNEPSTLLRYVEQHFHLLYDTHCRYRATYVIGFLLRPMARQTDLFGDYTQRAKQQDVNTVLDSICTRFGAASVVRGSSTRSFRARRYTRTEPQSGLSLEEVGTPLISSREGDRILDIPFLVY